MSEKLTLEQFQQIKTQLLDFASQADEYLQEHRDDENFNEEEYEERMMNEYLSIQNRLLNYDLSDIPFEAWKDFEVLADEDHIADFSKTKANIDFSIFNYYGNCIFKGCNVINLDKIQYLNPNDFDEQTIRNNSSIFLTDIFSDEFKNKYYSSTLTMSDFENLSSEQLEELRQKDLNSHLSYETYQLYSKSEDDTKSVVLSNIPTEVKEKYFTRSLQIQDLIDYPEVFQKVSVDDSLEYSISRISKFCHRFYGEGKFQQLVFKHSDIFLHLQQEDDFDNFNLSEEYYNNNDDKDLETVFTKAVKDYLLLNDKIYQYEVANDDKTRKAYYVPEWLSSMNYDLFVEKLNTPEDLFECATNNIFVLDDEQRRLLNALNIENIMRLEQETGFFTHKSNGIHFDLEMFTIFTKNYNQSSLAKVGIDFKNGSLSYEEFLTQIANWLNNMRKNHIFDYHNYDWIQGEFRDKHPDIFMDSNAPVELKEAFYRNRITPEFLYYHKEYISYLINKNLSNTINADMKLSVPGLVDGQGHMTLNYVSFIDEYVKRYGNEKLLQLISKYGSFLSDITISNVHGEIENEQAIEQSLRNSIYDKIIYGMDIRNYSYLLNVPEFVSEHPEIFVNFDSLTNISQEEKQRLMQAFYTKKLRYDDIKKYPELITILKDKKLENFFYGMQVEKIIQLFGNEQFLELCSKYGRYLSFYKENIENGLSFEEFSKRVEDVIAKECILGAVNYYPEDAPTFLKESHPELFLSDDAPYELKHCFYARSPLTFVRLQRNKDWMPFLKDKAITTSLLRSSYLKQDMIKFFEIFGEDKAIKLGINRAETVEEMMKAHQVDLMKSWYDKTGGKFIPDFVVMQNFNINEADKFLASGANWSNLMKIKNFAQTPESRDAMLKLAYSFGAFDQDQRGFKKLQDLLTSLPRKIDAEQGYIFEQIDKQINQYSQKNVFFGVKSRIRIDDDGNVHRTIENSSNINSEEAYQQMIDHVKNNSFMDLFDNTTLLNLLESLKKENVGIDFSKDIFSQLYRKNDDGSYTLTINAQSCPKSAQAIRVVLEKFRELPILTPDKAHHYLGGFKLEYDSDFREFFLSNFDIIISDNKYLSQISVIQRRFKEIKTIYSNVNLTLDLAMSYINNNKYENVNTGNERVTQVAALQNYSQQDFEILQQIYNYGKQRTFSSIPRISSVTSVNLPSGTYYYEILRLDDPRAMSIGFESDCCQRLGEPAEVCMEHSMVDKNGRVFIITNTVGEIVAQSWVWRNKDVLCFDNIEVPDQKMWDNGIPRGQEDSGVRNQFTDDILSIYKIAAHELIEVDEKVYRELLDSGKIKQEQYDGLRLGKITAGHGYSNIKGSLKTLPIDKTILSRPLPFKEPVKLSRGLYTSDSTTQYVLEEREDRKEFDGETLPVHSDTYVEYSDSNFTEKSLLSLEKLEIVTKDDPRNLETSVSNYADSEHLVTEIAKNYGLNPETARIIMHPNFAIIYDVNGDRLRIGDLLFNTHVDNELQQMDIENQVVMQIRLALEQIASGKEVDVSALDEKQKEMYAKVTGLTDEMDIERGVGRAR